MKKNLQYIFSIGLIGILFSAVVCAQEQRQTLNAASSIYVISAEAGGVNFVEGEVSVARKNAKSGSLLKGDELKIGDVVSTGTNGKAEILLNPGSFARLAGNSTFEFTTTSLEDLQLKLSSGSAMFEVITDDEFTFAVKTPKARFDIVKSGVYRVNVLGDGTGVIEVWNGRAIANGTVIKKGRQATVSGSQTAVAKFDRGDKDALETWSKGRAKQLARINEQLQTNPIRTSLMRSFLGSRWSLNDSYGLWIYSRLHGSYCFLPFGYGWSSPYGYYYPRDIWYYNLPPVIYNPPPTTTIFNGAVTSAGSTIKEGNGRGEAVRVIPPYQRVQKDIGEYPSESSSNGGLIDLSSPMRFPSSAPSSSAPPSSSSAPTPSVSSPSTAPPKKGN